MKKIFYIAPLLFSTIFANQLTINSCSIKGHTEVFGDSKIDPKTNSCNGNLSYTKEDYSDLKGKITSDILSFKSNEDKRDEHMYKLFKSDKNPFTSFEIKNVEKKGKKYLLKGILTVNGIEKEKEFNAKISKNEEGIIIEAEGQFNLTDYNMQPPKMLFVQVRDLVEVKAKIDFNFKN